MRHLVLSSMLVLALAAIASADWVQQGATDDFAAFEAESTAVEFDSPGFKIIDGTTEPTAPTGSSGGAGLWFTGGNIGENEQYDSSRDNDQGAQGDYVATYSLAFAKAGTYDLYLRKYVGGEDPDDSNALLIGEGKTNTGGNDSIWVMSDFDLDVRAVGSYPNNAGTGGTSLEWHDVGDFTVSEAQVGEQLSHALSIREDGLMVDRLIFVLQGSDVDTSDAGLDALANSQIVPEPATMALLGLGGLVAVRRRRK